MSRGRARPQLLRVDRPVRSLAGRSGSCRSSLSTSSASTACRRRCRNRSMSSPPSGRRGPTLLWCTALRRRPRNAAEGAGEGLWSAGVLCLRAWSAHPTYRAARAHGPRNPALARSGRNPAFRRRVHQERAGQVLLADDRQDGDPPLGRGVELQGRRSGRRRAARRVLSRNFLEVRSPAFVQAQAESFSQRDGTQGGPSLSDAKENQASERQEAPPSIRALIRIGARPRRCAHVGVVPLECTLVPAARRYGGRPSHFDNALDENWMNVA